MTEHSWLDEETASENQMSTRLLYAGTRLYGKVADIGSNSCFLLEHLKPEHVSGYYAVDGSIELLEKGLARQERLAKSKWKDHTIPCRFDHVDIEHQPLKFEDSIIDSVMFGEVLEHLKEPEKVLKEIYRVLKPGGLLILTTPLGDGKTVSVGAGHEHEYTMAELKALIKMTGFKIGGIQLMSQNPMRWYRLIQVFDCRKPEK